MAIAWSKLKKIKKTMNQHVGASLMNDFNKKKIAVTPPK